jgi:hypothetical protein
MSFYSRTLILEMNTYVLNNRKGFFYNMISQFKNTLTNKKSFMPFNVLDIYNANQIINFKII